ncbi:MAG: hypothetical protein RSE94_16110 [Pseudomonas sp.]
MAEHYHFESMSWNRYELEGDAFAQQSALLLERMLESVQQLRHSQVADIEALALLYAALTDPSQWFIEGYTRVSPASVSLPPGLRKASAADSFAYQCALFELALAQAEFNEAEAPAEVLDLHSFASQRLRAQLLADYPLEANYFPDDLILKFIYTEANPGGAGTGVGGGVIETQSMTLTEFAIANLSSLNGMVLHAIEHRSGQLIMDWMNPEYVKALIAKVDIGGNYPTYVAKLLDDPLTR